MGMMPVESLSRWDHLQDRGGAGLELGHGTTARSADLRPVIRDTNRSGSQQVPVHASARSMVGFLGGQTCLRTMVE